MRQKRVVVGRVAFTLGLLLLLLPLARWGAAYYWQQQALRQIVIEPISISAPDEVESGSWVAQLQEKEQGDQAREPNLIEITKIKLRAVVLPGVTPAELKRGPGLYPQSAAPSEGNVSIAAHRGVYGAWFRHIDELEPGDEIMLYLNGTRYWYSVREQFVTHDRDWSVVESNGRAELTLTTCLFGTSSKRLVVKADLVGP